MRKADDAVAWDVRAEEFTDSGHLACLTKEYRTESFAQLIEMECERNTAFLVEWERQILSRRGADPHWAPGLTDLFRETPALSGVLYVSQNHVVSEALFADAPEEKAHFTDRPLHPAARDGLSDADALTFSFPRLYDLEGFGNAWGFMRIERRDSQGNGAGVLLSVTTIDSEVMELIRDQDRTELLSMYNRAWDGAIHDYLHHIALYTNPSFGIGKISPMSLSGLHLRVDAWGEDMHSTFNYEYWAHRTHRAITSVLFGDEARAQALDIAQSYFREVRAFADDLLDRHDACYVQRVVDYLACIYLWPLNVLISPLDEFFDRLTGSLDDLKVDPAADAGAIVARIARDMTIEAETADPPRAKGLRAVASVLGAQEREACGWSDVLRLKANWGTQRGYYEGWFHEIPVMYQGRPTRLHDPAEEIIRRVIETRDAYESVRTMSGEYELRGISPQGPELSAV